MKIHTGSVAVDYYVRAFVLVAAGYFVAFNELHTVAGVALVAAVLTVLMWVAIVLATIAPPSFR